MEEIREMDSLCVLEENRTEDKLIWEKWDRTPESQQALA